MTKLIELDNDDYRYLSDDDKCYYYGEYTSGGGFKKSETNRQILNLKKKPTCSNNELYYKQQAIEYWGRIIAATTDIKADSAVTFVPMPCSKPSGHPEFDDRMLKVLQYMARSKPPLDIRPILMQTTLRPSQHEGGGRLTPAQLLQTMAIDPVQVVYPARATVVILDDVITMGASFNAAKSLIEQVVGVEHVIGLFLAKTVWPLDELDDFLAT